MVAIGMVLFGYKHIFKNLYPIARLILFPPFLFGSFCVAVIGVFEFFMADIWAILLICLSKDSKDEDIVDFAKSALDWDY